MRIKLIYPSWQRIRYQTHFVLPPLGVTVVGALTPPGHSVSITDENVDEVDFSEGADLVGISTMLLAQAPRAFAIADEFRARGVPVVLGGLTVTCLPEEAGRHADAVVLGEAEAVWAEVLRDAEAGRLKPVYRGRPARGAEMPAARRDLLRPGAYSYRGIRMMDLIETSRGCRYRCIPCQVPYVAGSALRTRPLEAVVEEASRLESDRMFIVDNMLEQDEAYQRALFQALKGAGKSWVAHPISPKPELLALAAESGCWFVYLAVWRLTQAVRERIRLLHEFGIGVQATVMLGTDSHGPDSFERITGFLLESGVDLAEFTIMTPFPGTPFFEEFKRGGRLLHQDWRLYNAENVVFRPARMTPEELQEGYLRAWRLFYGEESQAARMGRLYKKLSGRRGFRPEIGAPERKVVPNQPSGSGALWGGAPGR